MARQRFNGLFRLSILFSADRIFIRREIRDSYFNDAPKADVQNDEEFHDVGGAVRIIREIVRIRKYDQMEIILRKSERQRGGEGEGICLGRFPYLRGPEIILIYGVGHRVQRR